MELNKILNKLQQHKCHNREEVLANHIQSRLNGTLKVYYDELSKSLLYIAQRDNLKVIKKVNNQIKEVE